MHHIDVVFGGPPHHDRSRFVTIEDERGRIVDIGRWLQRPDGYWVLRISRDEMMQRHANDNLQTRSDVPDGKPEGRTATRRYRTKGALQETTSVLCRSLDDVERRARELGAVADATDIRRGRQ